MFRSRPWYPASLLIPDTLEQDDEGLPILGASMDQALRQAVQVTPEGQLALAQSWLDGLCPDLSPPTREVSLYNGKIRLLVPLPALTRMGMLADGECRGISQPGQILGLLEGLLADPACILSALAQTARARLMLWLIQKQIVTDDMLQALLCTGLITVSILPEKTRTTIKKSQPPVGRRVLAGRGWERIVLAMLHTDVLALVLSSQPLPPCMRVPREASIRALQAAWRLCLAAGVADRLVATSLGPGLPGWKGDGLFWGGMSGWISPGFVDKLLTGRSQRFIADWDAARDQPLAQREALDLLVKRGEHLVRLLLQAGNHQAQWEIDELIIRLDGHNLLGYQLARAGFADIVRIFSLADKKSRDLISQSLSSALAEAVRAIMDGRLAPGFLMTNFEARCAAARFFLGGTLSSLMVGDGHALYFL
jgi:hypothetical protein